MEQALAAASRRPTGSAELAPPRTTGSALRGAPDAVVLISVPGPSAMVEAMDAVEAGHDVMIFSDNVPVEQELALKRAAADRGVLVMGPDCGTAVIDGARPRFRQRGLAPARSASSPPRAPAASRCWPCSTTPVSA